jgi:hypothetical protein
MPENEQLKQQETERQEAREAARTTAEETGAVLCKHCGAALEPDSLFCPNCGEKTGGGEHTCEFCRAKTTKEFCPHCGRRVIPLNCPACGTPSIYDACENCGAILNPVLEAAISQGEEAAEIAQMNAEETAHTEAAFKALEANESAEFKAFQKKLIERQILLEERDYFNKREKRIIKTFGSRPFTLELPDPEEEAFRMKAYAALEKIVIEKQEKLLQSELEKKFPKLPPAPEVDTEAEERRLAEIERQREQMEKNRAEAERTFNEMVSKVENEVDAFRKEEERKRLEEERRRLEAERKRREEERKRLEAERKRKEEEARRREEERRRQMEIERRKLEEERRMNRVNGVYYYYNNDFEMTLQIEGRTRARAYYNCFVCKGSAYLDFTVKYDGNNVKLHCSQLSKDTCGLTYQAGGGTSGHNDDRLNFTGRLNGSGTTLLGYWGSGRGSFRSQYFGGAESEACSGTFYRK